MPNLTDWQHFAADGLNAYAQNTIEALNFDYCQMRDDGAVALCAALKGSASLKFVDFDGKLEFLNFKKFQKNVQEIISPRPVIKR